MSAGHPSEARREHTPGVLGNRMAFVDVLRAIAIITVLFHHLPSGLGHHFGKLGEWGGRGVDLFFVLSGFLIGSTCLERAATSGERGQGQQAKAYWLLRSARIFPLYFTLLAVYALGLPGFNPDAASILRDWWRPFVTFTSNYFGQITLELGIFWSLAIEEQFYLAVGLLILFCSRRRETLTSAFLGLSLAAIAVSLVYRREIFVMHREGLLPDNLYIFKLFHSTLSRMDQLAVGLITAVASHAFNGWTWARSERHARLSTWAVIVLCLGFLVYFPHRPVVGFLVIGLFFGACLLWVQRPAARMLTLGRWEARALWPVTSIGKLSFGLYVFHPITRTWVDKLLPTSALPEGSAPRAVVLLAVWIAVTTVLAAVSYQFFEEPILSAARRKSKRILQPPAEANPGAAAPGRLAEGELSAGVAGPPAS